MIASTSTTGRTLRADPLAAPGQCGSRSVALRSDRFSSQSTTYLKAALDRQPAVRPEVVERAKMLAADPDYPSAAVIQHVARHILASPDLSEDQT